MAVWGEFSVFRPHGLRSARDIGIAVRDGELGRTGTFFALQEVLSQVYSTLFYLKSLCQFLRNMVGYVRVAVGIFEIGDLQRCLDGGWGPLSQF